MHFRTWLNAQFFASRSRETENAAARQALAAKPGQMGTLIYMGTRWVGLDLLTGPGLLQPRLGPLCAGYVADAIGRDPPWHRLDGGAVLYRADPSPGPGSGRGTALGTPGLAGATLVAQGASNPPHGVPRGGASEPRE
jgi:hypothetical protein